MGRMYTWWTGPHLNDGLGRLSQIWHGALGHNCMRLRLVNYDKNPVISLGGQCQCCHMLHLAVNMAIWWGAYPGAWDRGWVGATPGSGWHRPTPPPNTCRRAGSASNHIPTQTPSLFYYIRPAKCWLSFLARQIELLTASRSDASFLTVEWIQVFKA